jgi:hypothetical protein
MESLKEKDIEGLKRPVMSKTQAREGLCGFAMGVAFACVVFIFLFGLILNVAQDYENALDELIVKSSPHQINFTKIANAVFEFPLHMDVEVLESLDTNCTCDWEEKDGWYCRCDVPSEFIITKSTIRCYAYNKVHFKLTLQLLHVVNYEPKGRFKDILDVNKCSLHIRYQYHRELKNSNKTVQTPYFYPNTSSDVTPDIISQPFYKDIIDGFFQMIRGVVALAIILFPIYVVMFLFERCRRFLVSLIY